MQKDNQGTREADVIRFRLRLKVLMVDYKRISCVTEFQMTEAEEWKQREAKLMLDGLRRR